MTEHRTAAGSAATTPEPKYTTLATVSLTDKLELRILNVLIGERRTLQIRRFEKGPDGEFERHTQRLNIPYRKRSNFADAIVKAARLMKEAPDASAS